MFTTKQTCKQPRLGRGEQSPLLRAEHTGRRVLFQLGEEQGPGMRLIDSDQMGGHTKV